MQQHRAAVHFARFDPFVDTGRVEPAQPERGLPHAVVLRLQPGEDHGLASEHVLHGAQPALRGRSR